MIVPYFTSERKQVKFFFYRNNEILPKIFDNAYHPVVFQKTDTQTFPLNSINGLHHYRPVSNAGSKRLFNDCGLPEVFLIKELKCLKHAKNPQERFQLPYYRFQVQSNSKIITNNKKLLVMALKFSESFSFLCSNVSPGKS